MNKAVYVVGGCAVAALVVGYILESRASASTTTPAAPSGGGGSTSTSSAFPTSNPDGTLLGPNSDQYLPTNANNVVAPYMVGYNDDA